MDDTYHALEKRWAEGDEGVLPRLNHARERIGLRPFVRVVQPGKLCSTYNLEAEDLGPLELAEEERQRLVECGHERSWPALMQRLQDRMGAHDTIRQYRAQWVGEFAEGTHVVVSIKAADNGHMPEGFVPEGPMFMVLQAAGIERPSE